MSKGGSGSSKPSWKNSKGGSGSKKQSGPSWKREKDPGRTADRPRSKVGRLIRYGLAFVACFGAIVWLILQLFQPNPAHVSLIGNDYAQTLAIPANVQGLNVLRSIKTLAGQETGVVLWSSKRLNVPRPICDLSDDKGWSDAWKTELRDMRAGLKEKTLLVVLALHGAVDPVKGPYLLVGSSATEANRLPLKDVIASFKDFPASKDVVLVLDAAQIETDWTLGILSNEFARELAKLKPDIEAIPNLWVLASCDADQHSWRSRDSRTSLFGQAFEAALKGAGTGESGRVNLAGLFDYVKKEVERQASESWGATQTPILMSKKDLKAASEVQINVVAKGKEKPDATVPLAESPLKSQLAARWKKYEELSLEVPAPTVYAPYHWRAYREGVVRYEELLRSGYPARPERLEALLDDLEKRMEALQPVRLEASEYFTLTMPGVSGRTITAPKASWPADFTKIWNAAGSADLAKVWDTFLKNENRTDEPMLKVRLYDDVLEKVIASGNDMSTSVSKLRSLVLEVRPRPMPAEVHFAAMLAQMVPSTAVNSPDYSGLFARVIGVRRQAERVAVAATEAGYGYGERVLPWIRPALDEADVARRQGEDLLFSSESKDWFKAAEFLTDAASKYEKAAARADVVRKALTTRDRALAELPFLSRWAVDRVSAVDTASPASVDLANQTETLWGKVYELAALLERVPDPSVVFPAATTAVETGLASLEKAYTTDIGDLTGVGGTGLPRDWDLDRALAVPTLKIPNRTELDAPRRSGGAASKPVNLAARNVRARLQARMAIASFGPWFDGQTDDDPKPSSESGLEKSEAVMARVESALGADSKAEPGKRAEDITWIGDQIGRRFREMPGQINRLAEGISQLDPQVGRTMVQRAERLERIVPGAVAPARTPTSDNRRRAVHDLLVAQAGRAWTDHWFADESAGEPYYLSAGRAYVKDAESIIKNSQAAADARKKLEQPGTLVFDEPASVALTSEPSLSLRYAVQPSEGAEVPPGFPVAWIEPGKNLQVVPASSDPQYRRVIGFGEKPEPVVLQIGSPLIPKLKDKPSNLARVEPSAVTVRGFFRGQKIERKTPVGIYPVPEVTQVKDAPPISGTVAVRADEGVIQQFGEGSGAIAIVLDCSGSMWEPGTDFKESRYLKATKALRAVLTEVPAGTKVSVWVFGEKAFNGREFNTTRETIQQLQPMVVWDPAMTGPLVDRAEQLVPQFYTPLVRTMIKARDDLFTSGRSLRTLLVLSDGADEPEKGLKFPQDLEFNPSGAEIEAFLPAAFTKTFTRINMVFFQTESGQFDQVRKNFGVVEGFDPPGFIAKAENIDGLIQNLKRGSDQKITYRVLRENNERVKSSDDRNLVSGSPDGDQWHIPALDPGVDKIQVETDRTLEQLFSIDNGDRLLLRLGVQPQGGLGFRRGLWAEDLPGRPMTSPDQGNGWRMTLVQNQAKRGGGLSLLTAIERGTDVYRIPLQQPKPFDLWVELQVPKNIEAPRGVVWGNIDGYPAPSWSIDAMIWPNDGKRGPAKPVIEAWWSSDREVPFDAIFEKVKDFDGPLDDSKRGLSNRTVSIDGRNVTIDSFTVEDTKLVVRMSHPVGFPVVVRLDGMKPSHQEHRFYQAAGKCTAIFSDTNRDEVQTRLTRVQLVSVDRLKREALKRNDHVKLAPNDPPAPNEARPAAIPLDR